MKRALAVLCAAAAVFWGGCDSTAAHRARQYRPDWDAAVRARLESGIVARGDTRLMVYVAFGPPLCAPYVVYGDTERWEYLGKTAPLPDDGDGVLRVRFVSSNDGRLDNPFSAARTQTLCVDFDRAGRVAGFLLGDAGARSVRTPAPAAFCVPPSPFESGH